MHSVSFFVIMNTVAYKPILSAAKRFRPSQKNVSVLFVQLPGFVTWHRHTVAGYNVCVRVNASGLLRLDERSWLLSAA